MCASEKGEKNVPWNSGRNRTTAVEKGNDGREGELSRVVDENSRVKVRGKKEVASENLLAVSGTTRESSRKRGGI